jgi:hypothetical protein
MLNDLHRFELFDASLLCDLIVALVGIVFEVSDIGDIADVADLVAKVLQIAEEEVEGNGGACVSEMSIAIDRRSAHIHSYHSGMHGFEQLFLMCQRIV